jgi:hypothetical protein
MVPQASVYTCCFVDPARSEAIVLRSHRSRPAPRNLVRGLKAHGMTIIRGVRILQQLDYTLLRRDDYPPGVCEFSTQLNYSLAGRDPFLR